ncbi:gluconolaconase [Massilia sp. erpn]|uniref:gluconolaconase n=1 Tax=Massilia sp. erpn TaxID=2738142 RepID=UPI00210500BB|nr:gluconolaconase [Massilia sp. erpn]UTY59910.1 gluconolaconase [Massilia sp. erpn]
MSQSKLPLTVAAIAVSAALASACTVYYVMHSGETAQAPAPKAASIRRTPRLWTARVHNLAGDGVAGNVNGAAAQARFADPYGIVADGAGNVYISDGGANNRIRKIGADGQVSTLAGGAEGYAEGKGAQAAFNTPSGLAIDKQGNLYVADTGNHVIRKVTPDGTVSTLAGNGIAGYADGKGAEAQFNGPLSVAVDADGAVFVADTYNDRIRRIAPNGVVTTVAGNGKPGFTDGAAASAQFDTPCGVAVDGLGNLYIADSLNDAIRKLGTDGLVSTIVSAPEEARQHILRKPMALTVTHDGFLYVVSGSQGHVVQIAPDREYDALPDLDHPPEPGYGSDGKVRLYAPRGVTLAADGALLVSDARTFRLHRLAVAEKGETAPVIAQPAPPLRKEPMLWPVAPQNAPHEVVGLMGEVRGDFEGESRHHFHSGLDIQADVGQPVLAVAPAKVSDPLPNWGFGSLSEGLHLGALSYIHMRVGRTPANKVLDARFQLLADEKGKPERVRVRRGTRFDTGETLGTVNGMAHVHLDYVPNGGARNALSLPFIGLRDTVAPRIESIVLYDRKDRKLPLGHGNPVRVSRELGELSIVVEAYDQMDDNLARRRLGLYKLGYQLLQADGTPAPGYEEPRMAQVYDRLPRNREAVKYVYAPNSGITVHGSKTTRFAYVLNNTLSDGQITPGMWKVADIAPGQYTLRILASDYAGNVATTGRDLRVTIE